MTPRTAAARWACAALVAGLALAACSTAPPAADEAGAAATVFLVRHAEKLSGAEDPALTDAGERRAHALARQLSDAGIQAVYSTDFIRTRMTAEPVAGQLGVTPRIYDWDELEALARELAGSGARSLVVGHSDTTPELVGLLGGEPGPPIDEKNEYDRLYVVTIGTDGAVTTVLLRYGAM